MRKLLTHIMYLVFCMAITSWARIFSGGQSMKSAQQLSGEPFLVWVKTAWQNFVVELIFFGYWYVFAGLTYSIYTAFKNPKPTLLTSIVAGAISGLFWAFIALTAYGVMYPPIEHDAVFFLFLYTCLGAVFAVLHLRYRIRHQVKAATS
jgi:hypothetical protein